MSDIISFSQKGDFSKLTKYLKEVKSTSIRTALEKYGKEGVTALASATPVDTGKTASSWKYEVIINRDSARVVWSNTNIQNGVPVAILIRYGHATRNGGFVQGRNYIRPAIRPIFDKIANEAWREVTKL